MSKIYPSQFNGKYSEKIPYEKFKNFKDKDLIIYYSRNYIYRTFHNTLGDGEIADFFVIHPKKGIILLKVKKVSLATIKITVSGLPTKYH